MGQVHKGLKLTDIFPCLNELEKLTKKISLEEYERGDGSKESRSKCDYGSFNKELKKTVKEYTSNGARRSKRKL